MQQNSSPDWTLRRLPDGSIALMEEGELVRVVEPTRWRLNQHIQIMKQLKGTADGHLDEAGRFVPAGAGKAKVKQEDVRKVEVVDYRSKLQRLYAPRLNLRTLLIEFNGRPIPEEEFDAVHVIAQEEHGLKFRKADMQSVIKHLARAAEYDPVADMLNGLRTDRGSVLSDEDWSQVAKLCLGIEDDWSQTVLQKWLVATIARAMEPGCKVDYCLILYGEQGDGKSTFFENYANNWFTDSMGDLTNQKDDLMVLHRSWIAEWSEADQVFVGANKAERIKRFVSSRQDSFRIPYGKTVQALPRRSLLVGTTNRDDWATDPTGNRRFPVLRPKAHHKEWMAANWEGLVGRAMVEWRRGTEYWFDREQEREISRRSQEFAPEEPWLNELAVWFDSPEGRSTEINTRGLAAEVLQLPSEQIDKRTLHAVDRVAKRLVANGVRRKRGAWTPPKASWGAKGTHTVYQGPVSS